MFEKRYGIFNMFGIEISYKLSTSNKIINLKAYA